MRVILSAIAGLLLLSACAEIRYAGDHAQATTKREAQLSQSKLKYILDPDRRIVNAPPQPIQPGYCYKNFGDIVCYKDPIPNARTRLVGYQEPLVRKPDTSDANGFEPIEYRDGDRSQVWNPFRNESNRVDAYVYPNSKRHSGDVPVSGSNNIYTIDKMEPVRVSEPVSVREFDMVEPMDCPKSCKKSAKKSGKKSADKKKSTGKKKAVKGKAKAKAKKAAAKKPAAKKAAAKKADASTAAAPAKTEKLKEVQTDGSAMKAAEEAGKKAPNADLAATNVQPPAPAPAAPKAEAPAAKPAAAEDAPKVTPVKKLEEIKYDKNAADPKDLIKEKK